MNSPGEARRQIKKLNPEHLLTERETIKKTCFLCQHASVLTSYATTLKNRPFRGGFHLGLVILKALPVLTAQASYAAQEPEELDFVTRPWCGVSMPNAFKLNKKFYQVLAKNMPPADAKAAGGIFQTLIPLDVF